MTIEGEKEPQIQPFLLDTVLDAAKRYRDFHGLANSLFPPETRCNCPDVTEGSSRLIAICTSCAEVRLGKTGTYRDFNEKVCRAIGVPYIVLTDTMSTSDLPAFGVLEVGKHVISFVRTRQGKNMPLTRDVLPKVAELFS